MVRVDRFEEALAEFERMAPQARNLADGGKPARLERLVNRVLAGDRTLADDGVLRELRAVAPRVADRFAGYLAFSFGREAAVRQAFATTELVAGRTAWTPAQAMARVRLGDPAERGAALLALASLDPTIAELEAIAPEVGERTAPAAREPERAGSILLPTPELMAELGLVEETAPAAREQAGPDRSRDLGALVLELAESVEGARPKEYGELRSVGRQVADFRARHPLVVGPALLPFEQPAVPFGREGARAIEAGDPWSCAGALFGAEGFAGCTLAFTAMTPIFGSCWADAGSDRRRTAQAIATAVGALALECHLVGGASRLEALSDGERDALGFSRPLRLARLLWIAARLEEAPGEETARYPGGARLDSAISKGAAMALDLRERFDEDWFRNPRVRPEVIEDAARGTTGSIDQVIGWLKESIRL